MFTLLSKPRYMFYLYVFIGILGLIYGITEPSTLLCQPPQEGDSVIMDWVKNVKDYEKDDTFDEEAFNNFLIEDSKSEKSIAESIGNSTECDDTYEANSDYSEVSSSRGSDYYRYDSEGERVTHSLLGIDRRPKLPVSQSWIENTIKDKFLNRYMKTYTDNLVEYQIRFSDITFSEVKSIYLKEIKPDSILWRLWRSPGSHTTMFDSMNIESVMIRRLSKVVNRDIRWELSQIINS